MKKEKAAARPPGRRNQLGSDSKVFNIRLRREVYDRLREQAEKEDRDIAYLVRVFVQAGLDDRAKVAGG